MEISGARVLVLGGAGFIGSFVVDELLRAGVKEVVIYDNFTRGTLANIESALKDPRCRIYENGGDIRDVDLLNDAMKGMDGVIHLAAMWLLHCNDFPRTAFHVNVEGTFNVLEACVRNGVRRLVYSSSGSVYGDAISMPMTEAHPFNNRNFYGATKISGEAMCRAFHERFGLDYVGLRYMNVYGPRQDQNAAYTGVIPQLLNRVERGDAPTIHGDGSQAYDFVNVRDVARSNVLALQVGVSDQFYNVGTGVPTSIADLASMILDLCGSDLDVEYQPYLQGDVRQAVRNRVCDPELARTDLGFDARIGLRDGLSELIAWRKTGRIG